jgi:hypothetical protein
MSPVGTGILLDAPLPQAPLFRLLDAATIVPMGADEHFLNGIAVRSWPCWGAQTWEWCNHTGNKNTGGVLANPSFVGFTAYVGETCNARGITPDEFRDRAATILNVIESYALEREMWTGATSGSPGLAPAVPVPGGTDATLYPSASTAVGVVEGLAQLEAAIATTGRRGLIHVSPAMATAMRKWQLIERVTSTTPPQLQTIVGSIVIPGTGYQEVSGVLNIEPGSAATTPIPPVGHTLPTGTQEWAFATAGPIEVRRSNGLDLIPNDVAQALDRVNDTLTYYAERHYVLNWDACFKAAVKIDRAT